MTKISRQEASRNALEIMRQTEEERLKAVEAEAKIYVTDNEDIYRLLDLLQRIDENFYTADPYELDIVLQADIQKILIEHGRPVK